MRKLLTKDKFIILMLIGLIVRVVCAYFCSGHRGDMSCFNSWSDMMLEHGPGGLYSTDSFHDYPTLYMYILWFLGWIKSFLPLSEGGLWLLLKSPAIAADLLAAYLLYKAAPKYKISLSALVLFNPAIILNGSIWGQVDMIFTLAVLFSLLLLIEKRYISSYIIFAISVMIKPQALFYTPLFLFEVIENVFLPKFDRKKLLYYSKRAVFAAAFALALCIPFGLSNVFSQYLGTLSSYPYCSVNAYNFWAAVGLNWTKLKPCYSILGTSAIIGAVALSGVFYTRLKGEHKFFLISGFICLFLFTFTNKMHERYLFPAIMMFFAAYALSHDKKILCMSLLVTLQQIINCGWVLFFESKAEDSVNNIMEIVCGILTVAITAYATVQILKMCGFSLKKYEYKEIYTIGRRDILIIAVLTVVYSVFALADLGDRQAPENRLFLENSAQSFRLSQNDGISGYKLYLGEKHLHGSNTLSIELLSEGESVYTTELTKGSVFEWEEYEVDLPPCDELRVSSKGDVRIAELAFLDKSGNIIDGEGPLFDEKELVPDRRTYLNSTYFDEIYHARSAYELIEGEDIYEWTHPPLGKILIGIGIRIFGMNPFGWRIVGTLFGVFMVPVIYIFSKKLFGVTAVSAFATVLLTFDFMHLAQTRIATIDVYVTFFIMLQYMFMLMWIRRKDFESGLLWLGLSGLCFGLSAAAKWTGIYAGAGLALIFFWNLKDEKQKIKTVLFCIGAFVIVPVTVYLLSYIPFVKAEGGGLMTVWQNQIDMLSYHGGVDAEHYFASRWYEWPLMIRPIWYYSGNSGEGISAFGNPLVWWIGILSFIYTVYIAIKERSRTAIFLSVGYLAEVLPWVAVTRITFIYHYFPAVPFSVLMTAFMFKRHCSKRTMLIYALAVVVLFMFYYPVLTGGYIDPEFVENFLRWSDKWVLVSG